MASLKSVKLKIAGIKKTKQITKAMNMVASAKLRGAQQNIEKFRPYADKFYGVLSELSGQLAGISHPLLVNREEKKTVGILLVTSDRGLCGGFNANLAVTALRLAKAKKEEGLNPVFYCVGRKGLDTVRKTSYTLEHSISGQMGALDFTVSSGLSNKIIEAYSAGELDEVVLVYAEFVSVTKNQVTTLPLLPISQKELKKSDEQAGVEAEAEKSGVPAGDCIYEPEEELLIGDLLPRFVKVQVHRALLDTAASEHAARMTAMDNATRNCDEITEKLTLLYNKTRQATITTDLIDIVSGAEALKG